MFAPNPSALSAARELLMDGADLMRSLTEGIAYVPKPAVNSEFASLIARQTLSEGEAVFQSLIQSDVKAMSAAVETAAVEAQMAAMNAAAETTIAVETVETVGALRSIGTGLLRQVGLLFVLNRILDQAEKQDQKAKGAIVGAAVAVALGTFMERIIGVFRDVRPNPEPKGQAWPWAETDFWPVPDLKRKKQTGEKRWRRMGVKRG